MFDEWINNATEVNAWRYYFLPMWQIIRHPIKPKKWYIQGKVTGRDDNGKLQYRRYFLKEVSDV